MLYRDSDRMIREKTCLRRRTWWDGIKEDMKSFGLSERMLRLETRGGRKATTEFTFMWKNGH